MADPANKSERGMALLMALFFIGIALLVTGLLASRAMQQRKVVEQYGDVSAAQLGADAALAAAWVELESGGDGIIGMDGWKPQWDDDNNFLMPDLDADGVTPQTMPSKEDVEYAAFSVDWAADERDNNGDGSVDDPSETRMYTVYAIGRNGTVTRELEVVCQAKKVGVWENAVFAGPGVLGGLINGSINARGSVHLLGDNLLGGVLGLTSSLGLGGGNQVRNYYQGIPNELRNRIPDLPETVVAGEAVETLGAEFRARNGVIGLAGGSTLGDAQAFGNGVKETLDGVFVTGGWIGDAVTPDGDRGDPQNVFSDNGWDALYDLADRVVFPLLGGTWRNPVGGEPEQNPDTGAPYTHGEYFRQVLVGAADDPDDGQYTGNVTIDARGDHFYWNATTGEQRQGSLPTVVPPKTDDYILFDKTRDVLDINGQIAIDGNLTFTGRGNEKTINYTGRGAILVDGNVRLDANLLTCNKGNPSDTVASFPVNNALGIMASENITIGSTLLDLLFNSKLKLMGAFYAEKQVVSLKQAQVAGTLVSNQFNLGLTAPDVFQVPTLGDNLPEGMVGDVPVTALKQISWRERDL